MFGVIEFHYYAIADGLVRLFRWFGQWRGRNVGDEAAQAAVQLELPLFDAG